MNDAAIAAGVLLYGVPAILLLMTANGLISFPPSEIILLTAGYAVSRIFFTFEEALAASVIGNVAGACCLYGVGRALGPQCLSRLTSKAPRMPFLRHFNGGAGYATNVAQEIFRQHDTLLLLVFRCAPLVRSIVSLPAGAYGVSFGRFFILTSIGCTIWCGAWILVGSLGYDLYKNSKFYLFIFLLCCVVAVLTIIRHIVNKTIGVLAARDVT
jgi:membrane protein DedA with SNARE-associated domain